MPKGVNRSNHIVPCSVLPARFICAAMPMLISILPLIGMQFLASHLMEGLLLAFGVGFWTLRCDPFLSYQHRDIRPVIALALGTLLIAGGFFFCPGKLGALLRLDRSHRHRHRPSAQHPFLQALRSYARLNEKRSSAKLNEK